MLRCTMSEFSLITEENEGREETKDFLPFVIGSACCQVGVFFDCSNLLDVQLDATCIIYMHIFCPSKQELKFIYILSVQTGILVGPLI